MSACAASHPRHIDIWGDRGRDWELELDLWSGTRNCTGTWTERQIQKRRRVCMSTRACHILRACVRRMTRKSDFGERERGTKAIFVKMLFLKHYFYCGGCCTRRGSRRSRSQDCEWKWEWEWEWEYSI